jgi:DNA helicase-2/ATP-dependent DNA helicase PcrA
LDYNLDIHSGTAKKLEGFRNLLEKLTTDNATQNAYELGRQLIREAGLITELYSDRTPEGLSRVQNVEELINSLHEFVSTRLEEGNQDVRLSDFLAEISLMTDQDTDKDEQASRVTMMTIHSAKGLEFKNVFVVGLEENLFPSERSWDNPKEIEEERRLFYVAITRAEENVMLTYAKNRFRNGQSWMCEPSRFIDDINPSYLQMPGENNFRPSLRVETTKRPSPASPVFTQTEWGAESHPTVRIPKRESTGLNASLRGQSPKQSNSLILQGGIFLSVGNTIRHDRFGLGKVKELTGENENAKATVEFESFGRKQLLLKFAKFEIVG